MAGTPPPDQESRPYPVSWESVAELRVFRATAARWASLIDWRRDMRRKGWTLLRVGTDRGEVVAVFGRTKEELLVKRSREP